MPDAQKFLSNLDKKLWTAAVKLRYNLDAAVYKHAVLGRIFLKYVSGFCYSAKQDEISEHGFVVTPGRYVGAKEIEDDDEPFEDKMERLTSELSEQFAESANLEKAIRTNLAGLGFELGGGS